MARPRKTIRRKGRKKFTSDDLEAAQVAGQLAEAEVFAAGVAVAASLIDVDDARARYKQALEDQATADEEYRKVYDNG